MSEQASSPLRNTVEGQRLASEQESDWRRWGPYLSERQWGTVREDYSADGDAWVYLPHDHARSRAYRWGEDGIAGFSDDHQHWCLSLALWNEHDPILKERMFGLANQQGNHGEDVKELWWYLDGVPSHAYVRMLYKYPQAAFPYDDLVVENGRRRGQDLPEYELIDTGIFKENRYFDVTVEYTKADADDILMRISVRNMGPDQAAIHVLPTLLARNTWSWDEGGVAAVISPAGMGVAGTGPGRTDIEFCALQAAQYHFCKNETNAERLFGSGPAGAWKDAINDLIVDAVTPSGGMPASGSKCAAHSRHDIAPGQTQVLHYRLCPAGRAPIDSAASDAVFARRKAEADDFYATLQVDIAEPDARLVQRQALAGMIWSKQFYHYDVKRWLEGDPTQPEPPEERLTGRNASWGNLNNAHILSMPDKWEYPWYASWDLAFHAVTMALIDPAFAKGQLILLGREWFMHPSGQLPAYEWAFGDGNPPIQAWAALRIYRMDQAFTGKADRDFIERVFHKLMINFTWWVNRKDASGRNLFQGGFLGLDNIGPFDRSEPLGDGRMIDQSDGTAWVAMFALNLMRMALELAQTNSVYEDIASKFFEHFLYIAQAMTAIGDTATGLWDEQDQFFYDVIQADDGKEIPVRVRSVVGLIPLCAVEVIDADFVQKFPGFAERARWMLDNRPELTRQVSRFNERGSNNSLLLSLLRRHRMTKVLERMLDPDEFLSDFGIRSLSKAHAKEPFRLHWDGTDLSVDYEPGTSTGNLFGGNSNWRGPIWLPLNFMLIESLYQFEQFYGDDFTIECPTGSGNQTTLAGVSDELAKRLCRLFLRDASGKRAVLGDVAQFQDDPDFSDNIPFHEFFHGDTGMGLGAAHQTGWTALVALLLKPRPNVNAMAQPVTAGGTP